MEMIRKEQSCPVCKQLHIKVFSVLSCTSNNGKKTGQTCVRVSVKERVQILIFKYRKYNFKLCRTKKKRTQRNNSHTLWKKMQLELDEQVHQYDADTWGAQKKYSEQIHSHADYHAKVTQISPKITLTSSQCWDLLHEWLLSKNPL